MLKITAAIVAEFYAIRVVFHVLVKFNVSIGGFVFSEVFSVLIFGVIVRPMERRLRRGWRWRRRWRCIGDGLLNFLLVGHV
jgi:hypothetical protein